MYQCEECGYCIKGVKLVNEHVTDESMRIFCPKHDSYDARYTDGRPLMDDQCPECKYNATMARIRTLEIALVRARATIRALHGETAWDIYDTHSPEMKEINSALRG